MQIRHAYLSILSFASENHLIFVAVGLKPAAIGVTVVLSWPQFALFPAAAFIAAIIMPSVVVDTSQVIGFFTFQIAKTLDHL